MVNAKELLQEWKERCNRLPRTAEEDDYQAILRALSLLAAAEANDGTTPETDAEAFDAIRIAVGRTIDLSVVSADFARLLERERNGLAAEVLRLKTMLPDDYERADMESREP